ncbi:hypothetical protein [Bdellovibrio sp. BCCA]|uniref:hypothetical protein n=1 Tax=Bdellovibrio sp. BCCA TaxID=3136281 RepID=UPI0030F1C6A8
MNGKESKNEHNIPEDIIENYGSRKMSDIQFRELLLKKVANYERRLRVKRETKANRKVVEGIRAVRAILRRATNNHKILMDAANRNVLKRNMKHSTEFERLITHIIMQLETNERYPTTKAYQNDIETALKSINLRTIIIADAFKLAQLNGHLPNLIDLAKYMQEPRSTLREYFKDNHELYAGMKESNAKEYNTFFTDEYFSTDNQRELLAKLRGKKRYFITSVACGGEVSHNGKVLSSIEKWAKKRDAEVILMPYGNIGNDLLKVHRAFRKFNLIVSEVHLNTNLMIIPFQSTLTLYNPQASLFRIASRYKSSLIAPAPKLTKGAVATDIGKLAHRTWTTGSITEPRYRTGDRILPSKHQHYAGTEHEISGMIVEIRDQKIFHTKEVMFDLDGSFVELRQKGSFRYFPDGRVEKEQMIHFSVPDSHVEECDPKVEKGFMDIARINKVKSVTLHDVMSYRGPGHHTPSLVDQAKIIESGWNYNEDMKILASFLSKWSKIADHVRVVRSNHDEHPIKALKGNHLNNQATLRLHYKLGLMELDGKHVLEESLKEIGYEIPDNVIFLRKRQRYILRNKIGDMAMHNHGDKGSNGARSGAGNTKASLSMSVGCGVAGHTHEDAIWPGGSFGGLGNGGMWFNGTTDHLGKLAPDYQEGPSTHGNTGTAVYCRPDGRFLRTQVSIVNGNYCLD